MVELVLNRIRLKRIEKAYSQEYIASKLNISQSYYAKIENSKAALSLSQLFLILSLLEIDYAEFFKYIKKQEEKLNQNKLS
jgi:transcriptional regulator with XRE-family HTH domain